MEPVSGLFVSTKWTPDKLKIFRIFSAIIMFPIFIWNSVFNYEIPPYLYLTSWGVYFTFLHFEMLLFHYMILGSTESPSKRKLYILMLFVSQIAFSLEIMINVIYWIFIFPFEEQTHTKAVYLLYTLCVHVISLILITTDNVVSSLKYQKKDVLATVIVIILYGILNFSYTKTKGEPVYSKIDWKDGVSIILGLLVLLMGIGSFFFAYWLSFRKIKNRAARHVTSQVNILYFHS